MVKILAIDASTEACSVAICEDEKILSSVTEIAPQGHTKLMLGMIDDILKSNNLTLSDMNCIACGIGPGSFTGVRIGVSMAQGLAFGSDLPMIGIVDLQAMAYQAIKDTNIDLAVAAIDARMGEVYLGIYKMEGNTLKSLIKEQVLSPENARKEILNTLVNTKFCYCGTGINTYSEIISELNCVKAESDFPNSKAISILAYKDYLEGKEKLPELIQPLYVRDTVTWKKISEQ
ncbi:MAG: tRNA (adenosine(37)-N6)-threonylcarbamoyltransferase complex dimerization subunit type 1 TsaB [Succinivibrionaceae bacterium]